MAQTLDPAQAKARFGELRHGPTQTYMEFEEPGGLWRPELIDGKLKGYRIYPAPRDGTPWWRKR